MSGEGNRSQGMQCQCALYGGSPIFHPHPTHPHPTHPSIRPQLSEGEAGDPPVQSAAYQPVHSSGRWCIQPVVTEPSGVAPDRLPPFHIDSVKRGGTSGVTTPCGLLLLLFGPAAGCQSDRVVQCRAQLIHVQVAQSLESQHPGGGAGWGGVGWVGEMGEVGGSGEW